LLVAGERQTERIATGVTPRPRGGATDARGVVAVVGICKGKESFSYHTGLADFGRIIPIDSNAKYRIAFISGSITHFVKNWLQNY